ncbi:MAG TPA: PAS domain-containing protein, partial [Chthoniobacteraceae bacterium]
MTSEDFPATRDMEMLRQRSAVFDHLADGVIVTTLEGVIIDWNRGAEEMFGWLRDEVIGKTPAILHGEADAPVLTDSINATAAKDGRWHGEIEFIRKDGSRGVCETTTTPLRNAAGEIFATLGVNHDITARRSVDVQVIEEHRVLRTLVDALPDLIFFKDREGRYLLHNRGEQRKWKTTSTEMIGKTAFQIPGVKENAALYHADDMRVIETGEPIIAREEPYTTPDGVHGWFLTSKYPLRSPGGEIIGVVGIARDITESKEAARRLADERERLRTVIDAIPDPLFVKDLEGRHLLNNLANVRAFNLDAYPNAGLTVHQLSIPKEHAQLYHADDRTVLETGTPVINREEPYQRPDGTRGWFLTSKFPLRDSAGVIVGLVGICRDVTEIKAAAAELQQTRQRLVDHVENSPLGVVEWSAAGRIERWAGRAEAIFGWASEEVVGRTFADWDFVYPADLPKVREQSRRLLEGVDTRSIGENRNFRKDGQIIHCSWQSSVLRDAEGKIVSLLSLVEDVTERVLAEQKIRDNERLFHTMVQATNTGYTQLDEHGRVLGGNAEFVTMTGRADIDALRGDALTQCAALDDFDRITRALHRCLESGTLRNFELEFLTPEGRLTPVEI